MSDLRWAAPTRAANPEWAGLLAAIEAVDQHGETYEIDDLGDEWGSVWAHPETDAVFVWDGAELVAFGWLKTQVGEIKEHRIACWGGVRPSHRGRGIGRHLLDWQLRRATEVAAGLAGPLDTSINLDASDHQRDLLSLARRRGFEPVRRFLEVARSTALPAEPTAPPDGLDLVPWSKELDDAIRRAHAQSFAAHWGSEPRSEEEWRQWYTGHRSFRSDLSRVAVDSRTGDVASLVLCATYPQDWGVTGPVEVWINTVGTVPEWRGRGAGAWVLTDVVERIAKSDDGIERSILGVDEANVTGALRLYRRLGFEDVRAMSVLARGPLSQ